ncbi:hypothetical protein J6590_026467 [Homalodisca vitripennis]|nr:hypothetical protein J6590_026467 [Homalodisca vitripennis]
MKNEKGAKVMSPLDRKRSLQLSSGLIPQTTLNAIEENQWRSRGGGGEGGSHPVSQH